MKPEEDHINLPDFADHPPTAMRNWRATPASSSDTVGQLQARLRELTETEGLTATDLLAAMVARRVLPLQHRPHLIC